MDQPNEFQPLMDEIFREKVRRARAQTPESKLVLGLTLFDQAVARMRGGIRAQFPEFTADQVEEELYRRVDRVRQVQQHGFFSPTPP